MSCLWPDRLGSGERESFSSLLRNRIQPEVWRRENIRLRTQALPARAAASRLYECLQQDFEQVSCGIPGESVGARGEVLRYERGSM